MRTTLTLDPDVAAALERIRTRDGRRFKHVLNDVLRLGLDAVSGGQDGHPLGSPTQPQDLGAPLLDVRDVSAAIAIAEGDGHR